ncbi:ABC transporter permease [Rhodospirillum sp. A1_3_36]|uniref:ABC transporter permease n=1 Tax=Rhodospirillum sp. A1_3_36 TaxID=3391666 RepID=UPI0039A4B297
MSPKTQQDDEDPGAKGSAPPPIAEALPASDQILSLRRIGALILRHWYLMRGSVPRLLEIAYWPMIQVITWGFVTRFLSQESTLVAHAGGMFIGAVLLWDVLFRANLGFTLSFYEELWSRNLGHLFVSPLRPYELCISLMTMSVIRTLLGVFPASLVALFLWKFNIYDLGLPLLAFFANLMAMGWIIGLCVSSLVLRVGLGAESMAWVMIFAFMPLSGVYYPIGVLPEALQWVAYALPPAHVFEGMREVMIHGTFNQGHFLAAVGLNGLYLVLSMGVFLQVFRIARDRGLLLNIGE